MGFTEPTESPRSLVCSYHTVSPLPRILAGRRSNLTKTVRRSALCCTFPNLTAGRRYRPSCPSEPGLSSSHHEDDQRPSRPLMAAGQNDRRFDFKQGSFATSATAPGKQSFPFLAGRSLVHKGSIWIMGDDAFTAESQQQDQPLGHTDGHDR